MTLGQFILWCISPLAQILCMFLFNHSSLANHRDGGMLIEPLIESGAATLIARVSASTDDTIGSVPVMSCCRQHVDRVDFFCARKECFNSPPQSIQIMPYLLGLINWLHVIVRQRKSSKQGNRITWQHKRKTYKVTSCVIKLSKKLNYKLERGKHRYNEKERKEACGQAQSHSTMYNLYSMYVP